MEIGNKGGVLEAASPVAKSESVVMGDGTTQLTIDH